MNSELRFCITQLFSTANSSYTEPTEDRFRKAWFLMQSNRVTKFYRLQFHVLTFFSSGRKFLYFFFNFFISFLSKNSLTSETFGYDSVSNAKKCKTHVEKLTKNDIYRFHFKLYSFQFETEGCHFFHGMEICSNS